MPFPHGLASRQTGLDPRIVTLIETAMEIASTSASTFREEKNVRAVLAHRLLDSLALIVAIHSPQLAPLCLACLFATTPEAQCPLTECAASMLLLHLLTCYETAGFDSFFSV